MKKKSVWKAATRQQKKKEKKKNVEYFMNKKLILFSHGESM